MVSKKPLTPEDSQQIKLALHAIHQTLLTQSTEISELRSQVQSLIQATSKPSTYAEIEPDCGYEWMWVRLKIDAATWSRIKSGEHISIKGKGWIPDSTKEPNPSHEDFHWDTWEFYGGINKPMKVLMDSPVDAATDPYDRIAYEGPLLKEFIMEFDA